MNKHKIAHLCFHGSLNDFLSPKNRNLPIPISFTSSPSIKDAIESAGVPHTEADVILVNNISVDFSYHLRQNDQVSIFPLLSPFSQSNIIHLQIPPPEPVSFVLDVHLGKLARFLRMMGFDSLYSNLFKDEEIVSLAAFENRVILTRDIGILKYASVKWGYWIRSQIPLEQLSEVLYRYNLYSSIHPFSLCMQCNGNLVNVPKEELVSELQPNTKRFFNQFKRCADCGKVYWEGSHVEKMKLIIKRIVKR